MLYIAVYCCILLSKMLHARIAKLYDTLLPNESLEPPDLTVSLVVVTLDPSAFIIVSSTIVFVTPPSCWNVKDEMKFYILMQK